MASSSRGITEATAQLRVFRANNPNIVFLRAPDPDTAPGPPPTPTLLYVNDTAAKLRWSPPSRQGASPVKSYALEYYSSSESTWKIVASNTSATSITLTSLNPAHSYGVVVRAYNAHGISEPSGIVEIGGEGGNWMAGLKTISAKLQETKIVLQSAKSSPPSSAKIIWQVSKVFLQYITLKYILKLHYKIY